MITHALVCPSLVGRQDELSALAVRRSASARGHGCLVLIEGEAGIGKSRLVGAFRETLTNGRASVGIGACREFGNAPYGPVAEAFAAAGLALVAPTAPTRAEQLIELRSRVEEACRRRHRVLILEDIQWADEATLAFLHYLLAYIGSMRLLVVATLRTDEIVEQAKPYLTRLARDRASFRLALTTLSPMESRHLIRLALGDRALSGAQIEEIVRRAEGNPFFIEELLTAALESATSPAASEALPRTIRAAVTERIAKLDVPSAEIATRAAVLGTRFEAESLAQTFGYALSDVLSALRRLRDLGLIIEMPTQPATYCFRHALTRDAIYASMLTAEARAFHARILQGLERRRERRFQDLGYHAWAAHSGAKCLEYNERAGDQAEEAHAHADAVRCYELALQGDGDADANARLLIKAAISASRDGMAERSAQFYDAAASALKGHDSAEQIAEIYCAMGSQARLAGDSRRAMAILDRAARELPEREVRARAMLRINLALLRLDRGEIAAANALIGEAQAASDLPAYHNALGYASLVAGDLNAFRAANAAYQDVCADLGPDHTLRARFNLAFGLCVLGIDGEAIADFETLLPELERARLSSLQILSYANAAIAHTRAGRLHLARKLVERGLAIPEPTTTGPISLASAALSIGHELGDVDLVTRCASEVTVEAAFASGINTTLGRFAGPYARWLHKRGEDAEAQAALRRAMRAIHGPFGATETILVAAELGDRATQEIAFGFVAALDELSGVELYAATALHLRALQARTSGSIAEASTLGTQGAVVYRALGWPLFEARCLELASGRGEPTHIGPLSERESEIAALVAGGAGNARIASDLAVSQRTIEKYLTSIYGKLGLRNRSELAALVARRHRS